MNCLDVKHLTIGLRQGSGRNRGGKIDYRDSHAGCRIINAAGTSADKLLVHDVSFSIGEGQTLAVAGESGSGKTLTALAVMGLLDRPLFSVRGACSFFSRSAAAAGKSGKPVDLFALTEKERKSLCLEEIAMIYQNPFRSLSPVETIKTHIKHICAIKRRQLDSEWLYTLFDAVQLEREEMLGKYPHELSGGELQRIMLVLAILFKPRLLICDEPTASLDYQTGKLIVLLLKHLKEINGMSLLFISHDISLVRDIADAVIIMKNGRIVETGAAEHIFTRSKETYTQQLIQAAYLEKSC